MRSRTAPPARTVVTSSDLTVRERPQLGLCAGCDCGAGIGAWLACGNGLLLGRHRGDGHVVHGLAQGCRGFIAGPDHGRGYVQCAEGQP